MAKLHTLGHQIKLLVISTLLIFHQASSTAEEVQENLQKSPKLSKRSVLLGDDLGLNSDKRFSNFRSDLGKRDSDLKRYSSFRSDLGKRSQYIGDADDALMNVAAIDETGLNRNLDNDFYDRMAMNNLESDYEKRGSFRADLGKRYSNFRSDLGKRSVGILSHKNAPEDLLETIKRYGGLGFRADLGKRSGDASVEIGDPQSIIDFLSEADDDKRAYRSDLGKRYSAYRSDLGKRYSSYRSDLGKRNSFRSDLGKRYSSYRSDLGKRQYFRADLGKRANFRADLGKRASFRADLGKRPSFRADLGKRSVDNIESQEE